MTLHTPSGARDYSSFDADNTVKVSDNVVTVDGTKVTSSNLSSYEGMNGGGGGFGGGRMH